MSVSKLMRLIEEKNNPTVVGLDGTLPMIPAFLKQEAIDRYGRTAQAAGHAVFEFHKAIIDQISDIVPAVKPQSAFYEMYGVPGMMALEKTVAYAKEKGMYVILDAKRGDIGSTASAYSSAILGKTDLFGVRQSLCGADGTTVNPYLGTDSVQPFLQDCLEYEKMIFVLVKTSNPSSGELQDQLTQDGRLFYHLVGDLTDRWGKAAGNSQGYTNVGAVVGATYPHILAEMRSRLKHTFFLVPGYGAQGGSAEDVARAFDQNGKGAIVNSSRGILCAYQSMRADEREFALCARRAALHMRDEINGRLC